MARDMEAIIEWAQVFTDSTTLAETMTEHYLKHMKKVNTLIADMKTQISVEEDYFAAGSDLGEMVIILIGPIEENALFWSTTLHSLILLSVDKDNLFISILILFLIDE